MGLQTQVLGALYVATAGMKAGQGDDVRLSRNNCSLQWYTFGCTAADTITTVTVNGTAYSANSGSGSMTIANMLAALVVAINAGETGKVFCSATATVLTIKSLTVGLVFTISAGANVASLAVQNWNAAAMPYGVFVAIDSNDENSFKAPALATDITGRRIAGVTCFTQEREATDGGYAINTTVAAVSHAPQGYWVVAEKAMAAGDTVYVRYAVGAGGSIMGAIRNDADTSSCAALDGCSVLGYDSTTGLAKIALNLPY